jgi:hypothetical protein
MSIAAQDCTLKIFTLCLCAVVQQKLIASRHVGREQADVRQWMG